jgi:hypothetical protein
VSYEYFWDTQTKTWDNVAITYLNSSYAHTAEFNMQSGTPSDHLDFWSTNTDTWDSLSSQQEAWGYVPSIGVSRTANLDLSSNINVPTVGFLLDGTAILAMESEIPSAANTIYVNGVTFSSTQGDSSVGNLIYISSIILGTTVNIPLAGTTTWDLEIETWTTTSGSWGYAPSLIQAVTANMTQTIFSKLNEEDVEKIADATIALQSGAIATGNIQIPVSATLDMEDLNIKNNINFEESASFSATTGTTSINNFLWNDEAEDTGTTWTKVSDPDE